MALESATTISQLVASNPDPDDSRGEGDDHIRMIKTVLRGLLTAVPGLEEMHTAQISGGEIVITSSNMRISSEVSGVGDTVNKISVTGIALGSTVILRPLNSNEPITVGHLDTGIGRISLHNSIPHVMATVDHSITLIYEGADYWRELQRFPALMTLAEYNAKWGLNSVQIRWDNSNPNNDVPAHLSAFGAEPRLASVAWSQITSSDAFGVALAIRSAAAVATVEGQTAVAVPDHSHAVNLNTGGPSEGQVVESGGPVTVASANHFHNLQGNTGGMTSAPQIVMDVRRVVVRVWIRTA